ncbi:MAG: hypothetical protein IJP54_08435 [Synergistaceae bacterium]|nr:hypothetical protein [Synergistaceae bacterium]
MNSYEHWLNIADEISALITKIESEIGAQNFTETADRHGLSKINKKLYEALEVAQKAIQKAETE